MAPRWSGAFFLFERLRLTAETVPGILDQVDLAMPFAAVEGKPSLPRARDLGRRKRPRRKPGPKPKRIADPADGTLRWFYETVYRPLRLEARGASPRTIPGYRHAINRLSDFAGHEVRLEELSDDLIERFQAWGMTEGLTPQTLNSYVGHLIVV